MQYRIETNDSREAVTEWADSPPITTVAAMNVEAYHSGQGGLYGIYQDNGERYT